MEILKIAWKYAEICWPYICPLLFAFAGMCYGIKLGHKWGKQDAEFWLKLRINNTLQFRLGQPIEFLNDPKWDGKQPMRVQGVLDLNDAKQEDKELGFPVSFQFTPDKIQWQPGSCSDPSHWPKQQ